jgi:SAM-dependent methyltransferase
MFEAMLGKIINRIRRGLDDLQPRNRQWRREMAERDARFDAEHGVDTTPGDAIRNLTIESPNRLHSFGHIASQPEEFARSMRALPIRYEDFAFVDLGSGKGRALLLALKYPFRERIGVEFALELYDVAQTNLRGQAVKLVHGDAARLRSHPSTLYVVYVNPFHLEPWFEQGFGVITRGEPFVILAPGKGRSE